MVNIFTINICKAPISRRRFKRCDDDEEISLALNDDADDADDAVFDANPLLDEATLAGVPATVVALEDNGDVTLTPARGVEDAEEDASGESETALLSSTAS